MARKLKSYTGFVLGLIFTAAGAHAGMIDKEGMAPWEICGLCHSLDGISKMSKFPILAGQKKSYLRRQLIDFKQGLRSNDGGQMAAIVDEFEISDIDQIVNYFAGLLSPVSQQDLRLGAKQEEKFQKGKLLLKMVALGLRPATLAIIRCILRRRIYRRSMQIIFVSSCAILGGVIAQIGDRRS